MKKLISLILVLMLAILAIPALAEDAQDPDMAFDPDIDPDFLVGAWESWTGNPLEIPDDVKAAFDKAMEGLVGCTYEPIAILGSQVVSGMNYCLLCKTTVVTPDAPVSYTLVYIYEALDGGNPAHSGCCVRRVPGGKRLITPTKTRGMERNCSMPRLLY